MTREEEIRARLEAYDATLGESIDVQLDSWRPVNKSAVTDLRFMFNVVDKERKEIQRLQQSIADWISGEQGRNLREENQRLRGALENIVEFDDVNANQIDGTLLQRIARKALEGETK